METRRATKSRIAIGSLLEDAFFFDQDRALIERLTELRKMAEGKEVLGNKSETVPRYNPASVGRGG